MWLNFWYKKSYFSTWQIIDSTLLTLNINILIDQRELLIQLTNLAYFLTLIYTLPSGVFLATKTEILLKPEEVL